jgi:endonuclease-3
MSYGVFREPVGALVKSIISCRTKDEVSLRAYNRLIARYPYWNAVIVAGAREVGDVIGEVTLAEREAVYVCEALRRISVTHPDFDLGFLGKEPVNQALDWLERLPGVGRKVSAATLNFSTLRRPALVIDTHVLRVLQRMGMVASGASTEQAYDHIMTGLVDWTADALSQLHCLIKRLGQVRCHAGTPDCRRCPVADMCRGRRR